MYAINTAYMTPNDYWFNENCLVLFNTYRVNEDVVFDTLCCPAWCQTHTPAIVFQTASLCLTKLVKNVLNYNTSLIFITHITITFQYLLFNYTVCVSS